MRPPQPSPAPVAPAGAAGGVVPAALTGLRGVDTPLWIVTGLLSAVVLTNAVLQPTFFDSYSIASSFATFVPLAVVALAQTMVILTGGIDLSIGASVTLASVVAVVTMGGIEHRAALGAVLAVGVGAACGLLNGIAVALLRLQPIIVTFATASVFAGCALLVLPRPGGSVPRVLTQGYRADLLGVPVTVLLLTLTVGAWFLLVRTRLVRHIYAVGGNARAAYASTVPVTRVQVWAYTLCGGLGGVAAVALLANSGSGDPFVGLDLTLGSVAAVVIGGTALTGGRGSGIGSIMGAVTLALIANVIFFAGVPTNVRPLVSGLVIVIAIAVSSMSTRRKGRAP